jgi:hypothetical protein
MGFITYPSRLPFGAQSEVGKNFVSPEKLGEKETWVGLRKGRIMEMAENRRGGGK